MHFLGSGRNLLPWTAGSPAGFLLYPRGFIHTVIIRFLLWDTAERRGGGVCVRRTCLAVLSDTRNLEVTSLWDEEVVSEWKGHSKKYGRGGRILGSRLVWLHNETLFQKQSWEQDCVDSETAWFIWVTTSSLLCGEVANTTLLKAWGLVKEGGSCHFLCTWGDVLKALITFEG